MHYCFYIRNNHGWFFLIFSEFSSFFQLFIFIALVKFALCSEESTPSLPQINYTLLDFYKIPLPLAFIFVILDFKDVLLFYLLQSNSHRRTFLKGVFLRGNVHCLDLHGRESFEEIFQSIFSRSKFH